MCENAKSTKIPPGYIGFTSCQADLSAGAALRLVQLPVTTSKRTWHAFWTVKSSRLQQLSNDVSSICTHLNHCFQPKMRTCPGNMTF